MTISAIKYYLQIIFDIKKTDLKAVVKNCHYSYGNIHKKLKENTIRYQEVKNMLNSVGYDLIIVDEQGKKFEPF